MTKMKLFLMLIGFTNIYFTQQNTPQKCVEDFFEAFHQKDTMSIKLLLHEEIVLKTVVNKGDSNSVISETIEDFLIGLASIPSTIQFKEDILSYKIEEDGALAHVWTPYHFFVNDKIVHEGINSFVLVKINHKWVILHLIDTRLKKTNKPE